jgi:hypothetical protein
VQRGDLFLVARSGTPDPHNQRVLVAVSRLPKVMLTRFVGHMNTAKLDELDRALAAALDLDLLLQPPADLLQ